MRILRAHPSIRPAGQSSPCRRFSEERTPSHSPCRRSPVSCLASEVEETCRLRRPPYTCIEERYGPSKSAFHRCFLIFPFFSFHLPIYCLTGLKYLISRIDPTLSSSGFHTASTFIPTETSEGESTSPKRCRKPIRGLAPSMLITPT